MIDKHINNNSLGIAESDKYAHEALVAALGLFSKNDTEKFDCIRERLLEIYAEAGEDIHSSVDTQEKLDTFLEAVERIAGGKV